AITHELKTPIAIAKLNIETLQKHQLDETKKQKLLGMTLQEINRLNTLSSNVLISAQLEEGQFSTKEELDFSDMVRNCVHQFSSRFPNRSWDSLIEDEIDLVGDPLLLQILVNNLLENAVKYSPPQSRISITLEEENHHVLLKIS